MRGLICQNKYYYIACFLFVIIGAVILLFSSKIDVTLWINSHYSDFLDNLFLFVNEIGTLWFAIVVIFAICLIRGWKTALNACACFLGTTLITSFGKYILFPGTPRPTVVFDSIIPLRLVEGVIQLQTESFPSGHTSSAFAIFTFLALILPYKKWHIFLAFIALSIGYARMYLSQHFITDVYTGMIIGITATTVIYWLMSEKIIAGKK